MSLKELADEERGIEASKLEGFDFGTVTLVDARDENEYIISTIEGSVNIPLSDIGKKLYSLPKDKPVLVFCHSGDWSSEVVELLTDADYDAYHILGGYQAYRSLNAGAAQDAEPVHKKAEEDAPEPLFVDALDLKCPGPIVKTADTLKGLADGSRVFVKANEAAFASDIKVWCERTGNRLLSLELKDGVIEALIEKRTAAQQTAASGGNDKTLIVFSGDLDKTIAAFIIANGAAAMGRKVTIFFTFWGLNILRKPKRMRVAKGILERCFGIMMPRGSKKLGLSRMNMGGMGAKMIRYVMKSKNVFSLEELMEQAKEHGIRLVACQMSMDIMGIKQEELIDGVELGGVSTFLGSAEQSDTSLFI